MTFNFTKALAAVSETGADMTKTQAGGDFEIAATGPTLLRLISYIELGKHEGEFKGKKKLSNKIIIQFELSGKNHPPRDVDGVKYPHIVTVRENLSLNTKARFFKLFGKLNWDGQSKHIVELLARSAYYRGTVLHREYTVGGDTRKVAELYDRAEGVYKISPPKVEQVDPESGEVIGIIDVKVPRALTAPKLFLWDSPDMDQWASIFVGGEFEERKNDKGEVTAPARSKNVWQNTIKSAKNFPGSPIAELLLNNGVALDVDGVTDDVGGEDGDEGEVANGAAAAKPAVKDVPTGDDADAALNAAVA